jgi:hypothetical protein
MLKFFIKNCWCIKEEDDGENMMLFRNEMWYREQAKKALKTQYPPGLGTAPPRAPPPSPEKQILDTTGNFIFSEIR